MPVKKEEIKLCFVFEFYRIGSNFNPRYSSRKKFMEGLQKFAFRLTLFGAVGPTIEFSTVLLIATAT